MTQVCELPANDLAMFYLDQQILGLRAPLYSSVIEDTVKILLISLVMFIDICYIRNFKNKNACILAEMTCFTKKLFS